MHFKNLETGEILDDKIENTTGGITWANDNKTVFYVKKDPVTLRANQFSNTDWERTSVRMNSFMKKPMRPFHVGFQKPNHEFLMIGASQTLSTEYRFLDANTPDGKWKVIHPRERDLEYFVDHLQR